MVRSQRATPARQGSGGASVDVRAAGARARLEPPGRPPRSRRRRDDDFGVVPSRESAARATRPPDRGIPPHTLRIGKIWRRRRDRIATLRRVLRAAPAGTQVRRRRVRRLRHRGHVQAFERGPPRRRPGRRRRRTNGAPPGPRRSSRSGRSRSRARPQIRRGHSLVAIATNARKLTEVVSTPKHGSCTTVRAR